MSWWMVLVVGLASALDGALEPAEVDAVLGDGLRGSHRTSAWMESGVQDAPVRPTSCNAALWTAIRENDLEKVKSLLAAGCSATGGYWTGNKNVPHANATDAEGEGAAGLPQPWIAHVDHAESLGNERVASTLRAAGGKGQGGGVCAKDPRLLCLSSSQCVADGGSDVGPCLRAGDGRCRRDALRKCARDTDCESTAPCVPGQGRCSEQASVVCAADADCGSRGGHCQFPGACELGQGTPCSAATDCSASEGACVRGGVCKMDATKPCAKDSQCGEHAPCIGAESVLEAAKEALAARTEPSDAAPASKAAPNAPAPAADSPPAPSSNTDAGSGSGDGVGSGGSGSGSDQAPGPDAKTPGEFATPPKDKDECCVCPNNIDQRWPDVAGSPDVNAMGNREYEWGKKGDEESQNPVQRKNQPLPGCCPCSNGRCKDDMKKGCNVDADCPPGAGTCLVAGSGVCLEEQTRGCNTDKDCGDNNGVCKPNDKGMCLKDRTTFCDSHKDCIVPVDGPAGKRGMKRSTGPCVELDTRTPHDDGDGENEDDSGDPYVDGRCIKDAGRPCDSYTTCPVEVAACLPSGYGRCIKAPEKTTNCTADVDCAGGTGPCYMRGGKCAKDTLKRCFTDAECFKQGPCVTLPGLCSRDVSRRCEYDFECGALGPCVAGSHGRCAHDAKRTCQSDENCDPCLRTVRLCKLSPTCRMDSVRGCKTVRGPCLRQQTTGVCMKAAGKSCVTSADCKSEGPCLPSKNRAGKGDNSNQGNRVCAKARAVECGEDRDCGTDGPCVSSDTGMCAKSPILPCTRDAECITQTIPGATTEVGPCVGSTTDQSGPFLPALRRAIEAERLVTQLATELGADDPRTRQAELASQEAERRAIFRRDELAHQTVMNHALKTPAEQACALLGKAKCRELVFKALDSKRLDVLTAWKVLIAGPAMAECAGLGADGCAMTLDEAERSGRQDVVRNVKELKASAQKVMASFQQERARRAEREVQDARVVESFGDAAAAEESEAATKESAEASLEEENRLHANFEYCMSPNKSTPECFCKALGKTECTEGLARSLLRHHMDAAASIREMLLGNASSPAIAFCRILGPHRCQLNLAEAVRGRDIGILEAWKFLVDGTLPSGTATRRLSKAARQAISEMRKLGFAEHDLVSIRQAHDEAERERRRAESEHSQGRVGGGSLEGAGAPGRPKDVGSGQTLQGGDDGNRTAEHGGGSGTDASDGGTGSSSGHGSGHGSGGGSGSGSGAESDAQSAVGGEIEARKKKINLGVWDKPTDVEVPWPACSEPFVCSPNTALKTEDACRAEGECTGGQTCEGVAAKGADRATCLATIDEGTGKQCEWMQFNTVVPGCGVQALLNAIRRYDFTHVKALVEAGVETNAYIVQKTCPAAANVDTNAMLRDDMSRLYDKAVAYTPSAEDASATGGAPGVETVRDARDISEETAFLETLFGEEEGPEEGDPSSEGAQGATGGESAEASNSTVTVNITAPASNVTGDAEPPLTGANAVVAEEPTTLGTTTYGGHAGESENITLPDGFSISDFGHDIFHDGYSSFSEMRKDLGWKAEDVQRVLPAKMPQASPVMSPFFCEATTKLRPLDLASSISSWTTKKAFCEPDPKVVEAKRIPEVGCHRKDDIVAYLQGLNSLPGEAVRTLPFTWEGIADINNLTMNLLMQGVHGHKTFYPWWHCTQRMEEKLGMVGCFPHAGDFEDNTIATCDEATGQGCECSEAEGEGSSDECSFDPDSGAKTLMNKIMKKRKSSKGGNKAPKPKADPSSEKPNISPPGDCDMNPLTNPLYFLFCIILTILKPLFSAFLDLPPMLPTPQVSEPFMISFGHRQELALAVMSASHLHLPRARVALRRALLEAAGHTDDSDPFAVADAHLDPIGNYRQQVLICNTSTTMLEPECTGDTSMDDVEAMAFSHLFTHSQLPPPPRRMIRDSAGLHRKSAMLAALKEVARHVLGQVVGTAAQQRAAIRISRNSSHPYAKGVERLYRHARILVQKEVMTHIPVPGAAKILAEALVRPVSRHPVVDTFHPHAAAENWPNGRGLDGEDLRDLPDHHAALARAREKTRWERGGIFTGPRFTPGVGDWDAGLPAHLSASEKAEDLTSSSPTHRDAEETAMRDALHAIQSTRSARRLLQSRNTKVHKSFQDGRTALLQETEGEEDKLVDQSLVGKRARQSRVQRRAQRGSPESDSDASGRAFEEAARKLLRRPARARAGSSELAKAMKTAQAQLSSATSSVLRSAERGMGDVNSAIHTDVAGHLMHEEIDRMVHTALADAAAQEGFHLPPDAGNDDHDDDGSFFGPGGRVNAPSDHDDGEIDLIRRAFQAAEQRRGSNRARVQSLSSNETNVDDEIAGLDEVWRDRNEAYPGVEDLPSTRAEVERQAAVEAASSVVGGLPEANRVINETLRFRSSRSKLIPKPQMNSEGRLEVRSHIPPLVDHSMVAIDSGRGALVFGGLSSDGFNNELNGDSDYSNKLYYCHISWDVERNITTMNGHYWLRAIVLGLPPSPRSGHTAVLSPGFGLLNKVTAMVVFGGYNGKFSHGYKNDVAVLANVDQSPEELLTFSIREMLLTKVAKLAGDGPLPKVKGAKIMATFMKKMIKQAKRTGALGLLKVLPQAILPIPILMMLAPLTKVKRLILPEPTIRVLQPYPWLGDQWHEPPIAMPFMPWKKWPTWMPFSPSGHPPAPRFRHSAAMVSSRMVVFGGYQSNGFLNDVAVLDMVAKRWMGGKVSGTPPAPRAGHTASAVGNKVIIYGGYGAEGGLFGDLHVLKLNCFMFLGDLECAPFLRMKWQQTSISGPLPLPRFGHAAATILGGAYIAFIGGYEAGDSGEDWRKKKKFQGFVNNIVVMETGAAAVLDVSPTHAPAIGAVVVHEDEELTQGYTESEHEGWGTATAPDESELDTFSEEREERLLAAEALVGNVSIIRGPFKVSGLQYQPVTLTLKGKRFGKCDSYAIVGGIRRCNETCTPETCNEVFWHNNNKRFKVFVGGEECTNVTWFSNERVQCMLGPGFGANRSVETEYDGVRSPPNPMFTFDAPVVKDVQPRFFVDAPSMPRGPFFIYGRNFGSSDRAELEIQISGQPCLSPMWIADNVVACLCLGRATPDEKLAVLAKEKQVLVRIDNQWSEPFKSVLEVKPPKEVSAEFPEEWEPRCPDADVLSSIRPPNPDDMETQAERQWSVYEAELKGVHAMQEAESELPQAFLELQSKLDRLALPAARAAALSAAAAAVRSVLNPAEEMSLLMQLDDSIPADWGRSAHSGRRLLARKDPKERVHSDSIERDAASLAAYTLASSGPRGNGRGASRCRIRMTDPFSATPSFISKGCRCQGMIRKAQQLGVVRLSDMNDKCRKHLEHFGLARACHDIQRSYQRTCIPKQREDLLTASLLSLPAYHMQCQAMRLIVFGQCAPVRNVVASMERQAAATNATKSGESSREIELDLSSAVFEDSEDVRPEVVENFGTASGGRSSDGSLAMLMFGASPLPAESSRFWSLHRALRRAARSRAKIAAQLYGDPAEYDRLDAKYSPETAVSEDIRRSREMRRKTLRADGVGDVSPWGTTSVFAAMGRVERRADTPDLGLGVESSHVTAKVDVWDAHLSTAGQQLRMVMERAELTSLPLGDFLRKTRSMRFTHHGRRAARRRVAVELPPERTRLDDKASSSESWSDFEFYGAGTRELDEHVHKLGKTSHQHTRHEDHPSTWPSAHEEVIQRYGSDMRFKGTAAWGQDQPLSIRPARDVYDLNGLPDPGKNAQPQTPPPIDTYGVKFVSGDSVCQVGKPPAPRRGHTVTALADTKTMLVFGGYGVRGSLTDTDDAQSMFANATIVEKARMAHDAYNDTFFLTSLYDEPDEVFKEYRLGRYYCDRSLAGYSDQQDTVDGEWRTEDMMRGEPSDVRLGQQAGD